MNTNKLMKTAKLLNDACGLLTELEHNVEDDYTKYRLDELFREVVKLDEKDFFKYANAETTDIAIRIMEYLIAKLGWDKTDQPESEWYSFELQDGIKTIIDKALGIKDED